MGQTLVGAKSYLETWSLSWSKEIEVAVFPAFVHLAPVIESARKLKRPFAFGGQDCSMESTGAFTSEISAQNLKEVGSAYCLIGHSERRQRGGETSVSLFRKLEQAFKAGLTPVYCIGETEAERTEGRMKAVLEEQMAITERLSDSYLIAYEPVWAIGTGKVATEKDILEAHLHNRALLKGRPIPILYGGSVNAANAEGILALNLVDGVLVGGASLKADDFQKIIESARKAKGLS